jgi:hypothetical protein
VQAAGVGHGQPLHAAPHHAPPVVKPQLADAPARSAFSET